jgi:hypothetical protein
MSIAALGGLVVSVLAMGPIEFAAAGSSLTVDGITLWVIKIRSAHFLQKGSKRVSAMS